MGINYLNKFICFKGIHGNFPAVAGNLSYINTMGRIAEKILGISLYIYEIITLKQTEFWVGNLFPKLGREHFFESNSCRSGSSSSNKGSVSCGKSIGIRSSGSVCRTSVNRNIGGRRRLNGSCSRSAGSGSDNGRWSYMMVVDKYK